MEGLLVHAGASRVGRQELRELPTPAATDTHKPIPHAELVEAIVESLAYRQLRVVRDEYAVTPDGMRLFGFIQVNLEENGIQLAVGVRNSHDKSFSLGLVAGYRVFVCDNLALHGAFAALTRKKHTKHVDLVEVIGVGIDRVQRHFQKTLLDIDAWRGFELSDVRAKAIIYDAFLGRGIDCPQHLGKIVHRCYFAPTLPEFEPRNLWSLSNAFTSAFKELEPVRQMEAAASLQPFLARYH